MYKIPARKISETNPGKKQPGKQKNGKNNRNKIQKQIQKQTPEKNPQNTNPENKSGPVDENQFIRFTRDMYQVLLENLLTQNVTLLNLNNPSDIVEKLFGYKINEKKAWQAQNGNYEDGDDSKTFKQSLPNPKMLLLTNPEHLLFYDVWDRWLILNSFNNFIDNLVNFKCVGVHLFTDFAFESFPIK